MTLIKVHMPNSYGIVAISFQQFICNAVSHFYAPTLKSTETGEGYFKNPSENVSKFTCSFRNDTRFVSNSLSI